MGNLLAANFMRLRRSRVLWLCMAYEFCQGLMVFYNASVMAQQGTSRWAPSFQLFGLGGVVFAVYCSFFIAEEYAEGGVRIKLVVGTPRPLVYLANWTSCTAACLLICACYIVPNWALEYFVLGSAGGLEYIRAPGETLLLLAEAVLVAASFNAIFIMIGMNIQRKTGGPVAVLLTAAALIYFGQGSRDMLLLRSSSPERYAFSPLEELRYRLFAEWLPGGQAIHCVSLGSFWTPEGMILRALVVIAVSTGVGICLFRRKDLK